MQQSESSPTTLLWRRKEERYSSYSFTTTVLDAGEWSASVGISPGGKHRRYLLDRRLGASGHRGQRKSPFASVGDRTLIARSSSP
jgi:hypothetical protein